MLRVGAEAEAALRVGRLLQRLELGHVLPQQPRAVEARHVDEAVVRIRVRDARLPARHDFAEVDGDALVLGARVPAAVLARLLELMQRLVLGNVVARVRVVIRLTYRRDVARQLRLASLAHLVVGELRRQLRCPLLLRRRPLALALQPCLVVFVEVEADDGLAAAVVRLAKAMPHPRDGWCVPRRDARHLAQHGQLRPARPLDELVELLRRPPTPRALRCARLAGRRWCCWRLSRRRRLCSTAAPDS